MTENQKREMEKDLSYHFDKINQEVKRAYEAGFVAGKCVSKVLPHPCDGELYARWTDADFLVKACEENQEVLDAWVAYRRCIADRASYREVHDAKDHLLRECTDAIVAITSFMEKLGCGRGARGEYMRAINWSNSQRDGGKRFKDNPWHYTEEEQREIQEEIERDKD